jgi:hypothetical protein
MKLKTVKRFTRIFKSLQFNSNSAEGLEFLSLESVYDEEGKLLEEIKYREDGTMDERNLYRWENNQLVLHLIEMPDEGMREEYRYTRTDEGKLLKEQKFYGDDAGEATEYFYNADGQVEKVIQYDADGQKEQEEHFDYENKLLKKHRIFDGNEALLSVSEYVHENSRPVMRTDNDGEGTLLHNTSYHYDDKGNLIKTITTNPQGKVIESYSVSFDEKGNITEKAFREFHPRTFRYQYDEQNRCTEEEMYNAFGQLASKTVYEYNEAGELLSQINYNLDHHHSHHDSNKAHRFEYGFA